MYLVVEVNQRPATGEFLDGKAMGTDPIIAAQSDIGRYEAIVRISEAIAACREPEQLATTLADEIGKFLNFDHLYLTVLKENSKEIEYLLWGKSPIPWPDLPMEELPTWVSAVDRGPRRQLFHRQVRPRDWALAPQKVFDFLGVLLQHSEIQVVKIDRKST